MPESQVAPVSEDLQKVRMLSITEVMNVLKISRSTFYALATRELKPLPTKKIGKSRRVPFDKLQAWMENLGK